MPRPARLALGAVCLLAAALIVAAAGLPERAAFTGRIVPGEGVIAPEIGALAPSFEAGRTDGSTLRLDALRGSPVVLNFWATWCAPCRLEMPELQALYEAEAAHGLRVLAVNTGETSAAVDAWARDFGLTFDLLLDERGTTAARYFLRGQPSTYVIAPDGIITHIFYGPTTADTLRAALAPFLTDSQRQH